MSPKKEIRVIRRRERTLEKGRPEEEVERGGGGGDEGSGKVASRELFGFSILLRVDENQRGSFDGESFDHKDLRRRKEGAVAEGRRKRVVQFYKT